MRSASARPSAPATAACPTQREHARPEASSSGSSSAPQCVARRVLPRAHLGRELQQPRQPVRPLPALAAGRARNAQLGREMRVSVRLIASAVRARHGPGRVGMQPAGAHQRPVTVHARVPVECPAKRGRQRARAARDRPPHERHDQVLRDTRARSRRRAISTQRCERQRARGDAVGRSSAMGARYHAAGRHGPCLEPARVRRSAVKSWPANIADNRQGARISHPGSRGAVSREGLT